MILFELIINKKNKALIIIKPKLRNKETKEASIIFARFLSNRMQFDFPEYWELKRQLKILRYQKRISKGGCLWELTEKKELEEKLKTLKWKSIYCNGSNKSTLATDKCLLKLK